MKYVPVTEDIKSAIKLTAKELGSNAKLAELVGMSPATIGSYLLGRRHNIKEDQYKKLYPYIKDYLNEPSSAETNTTAEYDLSETATNLARFYDSLDEPAKDKIQDLWREMLMEIYSKTHF